MAGWGLIPPVGDSKGFCYVIRTGPLGEEAVQKAPTMFLLISQAWVQRDPVPTLLTVPSQAALVLVLSSGDTDNCWLESGPRAVWEGCCFWQASGSAHSQKGCISQMGTLRPRLQAPNLR